MASSSAVIGSGIVGCGRGFGVVFAAVFVNASWNVVEVVTISPFSGTD